MGLLTPRLVLLAWLLALPTLADASAACSHWASPNGQGAACTQAQPCKVASFWAHAGPGTVLCLKDGTYQGEESLIFPPLGVRGSKTAPVTIRAEHDGKVLLDAQHSLMAAVSLSATNHNDWFVLEGLNATNGTEYLYTISGQHNLLARSLGWNGTTGWSTVAISITGYNSRAEDCGGWGHNLRKIFQGSQSGNVRTAGYRRCWGEWNDHPETPEHPNNTMQVGYNTTNQLFENMLLTWDTTGQVADAEGLMAYMENQYDEPNEIEGTRVLGSLLYIRPGATFSPRELVHGGGISGFSIADLAMVVAPGYPQVRPAWFIGCNGETPCRNNVCTNCLAVHDGKPILNDPASGFTLPGLHQGKGLAAATGGRSAFELLPGLCKRYVDGKLTDQPLWPWPMNDRIKAARAQSGFAPVDVTVEVEQALGPIPAACKTGGTPPGPGADTEAPRVAITAPAHAALVSGTAVAVAAEASDNVGVVSLAFLLDEVPIGEVAAGGQAYVLADSTTVPNGLHKLRAVARDAAGNASVGGTIDVTVYNAAPGPPTRPAAVPLTCTGVLGAQSQVAIACGPQATP
jgi:hypothetical protein